MYAEVLPGMASGYECLICHSGLDMTLKQCYKPLNSLRKHGEFNMSSFDIFYLGCTVGGPVVTGYCAELPIERSGVQTPARADTCVEISAPPAPHRQLIYDE